jgi:carboxypeptidase Taq
MTVQSEWVDKAFAHARQIGVMSSTLALLEWDQHTYMPAHAGEYRSDQVTWLSGLLHQKQTDAQYGDWLHSLASSDVMKEPESPLATNVRGLLRDYQKNIQLPESLVKALAKATSLGQHIWVEARANNDFERFLPILDEIVALRKEEATILQKEGRTKYDSLLDQYEEGADSDAVASVFATLRDLLVPIVRQASENEKRIPRKLVFHETFPVEAQRRLSRFVAEQIGFDFHRGRLDETAHPFCTTLGPHDHRILTRYLPESYSSGLYGVLHEAGHGMYEQGTAPEQFGLPAGSAASLGVHESQSRLWENMVGRSSGFWRWLLPHAKREFPQLVNVAVEQIVADVNRVEPSLIRVEADEATYNLHIFVRFEIEKELIDGDLRAKDLPGVWNARYREYLNVDPPDNAQGVLQDVHWSAGLIGYFPTYTLGNLYAAQLYHSAQSQLGDLEKMFAKGEFQPLLEWLRVHVHRPARCLLPHHLMERVNGQPLDAKPFVDYLRNKVC